MSTAEWLTVTTEGNPALLDEAVGRRVGAASLHVVHGLEQTGDIVEGAEPTEADPDEILLFQPPLPDAENLPVDPQILIISPDGEIEYKGLILPVKGAQFKHTLNAFLARAGQQFTMKDLEEQFAATGMGSILASRFDSNAKQLESIFRKKLGLDLYETTGGGKSKKYRLNPSFVLVPSSLLDQPEQDEVNDAADALVEEVVTLDTVTAAETPLALIEWTEPNEAELVEVEKWAEEELDEPDAAVELDPAADDEILVEDDDTDEDDADELDEETEVVPEPEEDVVSTADLAELAADVGVAGVSVMVRRHGGEEYQPTPSRRNDKRYVHSPITRTLVPIEFRGRLVAEPYVPQVSTEKQKALAWYRGENRTIDWQLLELQDRLESKRKKGETDEDRVWQDYSRCLGVDPDMFFPERGASTREAKEVCRGCVVKEPCLEYALSNGEKFGIWGGLSERERRRIRRQRAQAARRTATA
jgi:WhiB family redox-sensing transcriptional regulator